MNYYLKVSSRLQGFSAFVLMFLFIVLTLNLDAQSSSKYVSGVVINEQGSPIIGASIILNGTQRGVSTNMEGRFTIAAEPGAVLSISYIGSNLQEIEVGNQTNLKIILTESVNKLEDIVVVGFGTQRKETVTGAISQVSGDALMRSPVTNISNALVGRIAGLTAVQNSGEAGFEESTIRIRGVGTYTGDQNPLIVIDGIIRDMRSFNMLDPNDIESVNVMKDASATAVYGVRGANGVVIVKTKQGKKGEIQVSFSANLGFTTPTTLTSLVDSYDYATLRNEAFVNDGNPNDLKVFTEDELWKFQNNRDYTPDEVAAMPFLTPEQRTNLLNSPAVYYGSTDYMDAIFNAGISPQQQYNVNVSGGSDKVSYYTSLGYQNQKSITDDFGFDDAASNSGSDRYNFRTNFDFKVIPFTEINVSISGQVRNSKVITDRNSSSSQGDRYRDLLINIYEAPPYSTPGVIDGKLINGYAGGSIMSSNKGAWDRSPITYMLEKAQANINESNLNSSVRIKHTMDYLLKGLSVRGAVSYDHYFTKTLKTYPNLSKYSFTRNPENPTELLFFGGEASPQEKEETGWGKNRKIYAEGGIDFVRDFGPHSVTAMALLTAERYIAPGFAYNVPKGFYGAVARATYAYDQRYMAEFNMGYNGSENFAPGMQFGCFPAVSAGWVLSNESFFPKNDILTWVKFRGSYGQTGNSNIGGSRFLYLPGTWASHSGTPLNSYYFGSSNGTVTNPLYGGKYEYSVGNPDVTWEKKESYNLAAEIRMFSDRLSVTVDVFKENRNNILTRLDITPGIIGIGAGALPPVNLGRMSNKGYEIQASWADFVNNDFWYRIDGQLSYAVNNIDYKAEANQQYDWMNETGFAYGQFKSLYNEGFYNNPEEVANHPYNAIDGNNVQGGDLRIVDVNGDGKIDEKDITPTGYSNIPRFAYSANLSIGYKGIEISALFTGTAQGTFSMNDYLITPFSQGNSTPLEYMTGRWTQERYSAGEEITFPRMSANMANGQNSGNNSFWFRSTDHIKLKNVEAAYTFKDVEWLLKAHISSIRLFVNANNLCTFGNNDLIDSIDPELAHSSEASKGIIYPLTRTFNIGCNIQF